MNVVRRFPLSTGLVTALLLTTALKRCPRFTGGQLERDVSTKLVNLRVARYGRWREVLSCSRTIHGSSPPRPLGSPSARSSIASEPLEQPESASLGMSC